MAKAEIAIVDREIVTVVQDTYVDLRLSEAEAETLLALLAHVEGGNNSRKKHTNAIQDALFDAGLAPPAPTSGGYRPFTGKVTAGTVVP